MLKEYAHKTIVGAFYESFHVAEQFAINFMKINHCLRKFLRFENFDGPNPERGCEGMTSWNYKYLLFPCKLKYESC